MQHKSMALATVASLGLLLSACGSSDEDEVLTPNATSSGVVSGFGSVYVNGLRYVTEQSSIIGNGNESSEEALKVGMKVVIKANQSASDDPTALEVKYLADAIGIIESLDLAASSFNILGQTYFITPTTKFDAVTFNELHKGMAVELSAFQNVNGSFAVSYLTTKDDISEQQLTGIISNFKKLDKTFSIGNLAVNYSDADVQGALYNGATVSIKSDVGLVSDEFYADEVNIQGMLLVIGGTLTVSGIVDDIDKVEGGSAIKVDGRNFLLTDESEFSQGDEDNLSRGDHVSLVATVIESDLEYPYYPINSIRVELANEVSLEGIVKDISENSFTMFDQAFTVDSYTQYEDDSEQELRYFNFADIAIGDRLEVDAYELDGVLVSRNIEREETGAEEQDSHDIEGLVDSIDSENFSLTVKGITVLTDEKTELENAFGNHVEQDKFFSDLKLNDEVEVEVTYTANGWLALEIEVDSDDKDNDVELLGRIEVVQGSNIFIVNGHQVITSDQTDFENGTEANMIKGALIEVEGTIGNQGSLFAEEIEFIEAQDNL